MLKFNKQDEQLRINKILELLDREYGTDHRCYLNHETPWQLLIATMFTPSS